MRFAFTEEQQQLRDTVRSMLDKRGANPPQVLEAPPGSSPSGDDRLWKQLADQIGATGLGIPEEFGGVGAGAIETNIVVEELGRGLATDPYLGSVVISASALLATGDADACARLLPSIASGTAVATLAWAEPGNPWPLSSCMTAARHAGDQWLLDGEKSLLLDAPHADVVLVVAYTDRGTSLFELEPDAVAAALVGNTPMDPVRRMGGLRLSAAPARLVGAEGSAGPALARTLDVAAAALAAEQVGAAQHWLWETVEYTKTRKQFGRPIGSFQAIKHRLADLFVAVESARSLSYAASWAVATGSERATELAAMAKSYCSETYTAVAAEGIQLHGGIGITWEHPAHLHLKRAHADGQLFGTPARHRGRLETVLGIG